MGSIVLELQRDSVGDNVGTASLLRKVLLVATKLDIDELRKWALLELNGYGDTPVPPYREIHAEVFYRSSSATEWIPFDGRLSFPGAYVNFFAEDDEGYP